MEPELKKKIDKLTDGLILHIALMNNAYKAEIIRLEKELEAAQLKLTKLEDELRIMA